MQLSVSLCINFLLQCTHVYTGYTHTHTHTHGWGRQREKRENECRKCFTIFYSQLPGENTAGHPGTLGYLGKVLGCSGGRGERRELWPSTFVVVSAERKGQGRKAGLRLAIFSVWFGTKLLSLLVWYLAPGREVDKGVARRSCSRTTQWPLGRTSKLDQACKNEQKQNPALNENGLGDSM